MRKLEGIKICDVVVISCLLLNVLRMTLNFFGPKHMRLYSSVVERWPCDQNITGSHTSWGYQLKNVYHRHYCFQTTSTCQILTVANFANINSNECFCPVGYIRIIARGFCPQNKHEGFQMLAFFLGFGEKQLGVTVHFVKKIKLHWGVISSACMLW